MCHKKYSMKECNRHYLQEDDEDFINLHEGDKVYWKEKIINELVRCDRARNNGPICPDYAKEEKEEHVIYSDFECRLEHY